MSKLNCISRLCLTQLVALLVVVTLPAEAAAPREALQHFVDRVHTLRADFKQVQTDEKGRVVKSQTGQMWLSRPTAAAPQAKGQFRWSYEKPYAQLLVCDGRTIWVYDPDLKQVTERPAKQVLTGSPAALLSQRAAIRDTFDVQDAGDQDGLQVVRLLPKSKDSDFKSIELSLRDGVPARMVFRDQLGDATTVTFSRVQTNVSIAASEFTFTPPAGVDVVGGDSTDHD